MSAAKRLGVSLVCALLWFALTAAFSYKAEGILYPLDRSGALPLAAASKYLGAIVWLQILGGFSFPWIRRLLDPALGGPGLGATALAALAGTSGSLVACGVLAAQYPAARALAALWAAACLLAAGLTAVILPLEQAKAA